MRLSVVVPTKNRPDELRNFLASLWIQQLLPDQLIIIDQSEASKIIHKEVNEKATELGVTHITPLMGQRSVVRLTGERAEKRRAHWKAIAVGACEQCGRNRLPLIDTPLDLAHWLRGQYGAEGADNDALKPRQLILSLMATTSAGEAPVQPSNRTCVLIGPEGGFTPEEEQLAMAHGFSPYSLGSRVLRTETAAITATYLFSQ